MATTDDDNRQAVKGLTLAKLDAELEVATRAGFYGQIELRIQDGFIETLRVERTQKIPRPRAA